MGCKIVHIADDGLQHCPDFIVHASNPQLCSHFYLKQFLIKMADAVGVCDDVLSMCCSMAEDTQLQPRRAVRRRSQHGLRAAAVPAVSDVTILNL